MIKIENLHVTFFPKTSREKKALRGLTLNIKPEEFVTVIGSNGAGKSTLLNSISGEILPTMGKVFIRHQDVTNASTPQRAKKVARVFQDPLDGTCGNLTIAENLAIASHRRGGGLLLPSLKKDHMSHFHSRLKYLNMGLENRLDTRMDVLSGGQRQAISLLMATLSPLNILLLDEHTSALDPKTAEDIMRITEKIVVEKKLTVLMVTHSLNQALKYGNRLIMLHEGRIIFDACAEKRKNLTPQDLLERFGASVDSDSLLF